MTNIVDEECKVHRYLVAFFATLCRPLEDPAIVLGHLTPFPSLFLQQEL